MSSNRHTPRPGRDGGRGSGHGPLGNRIGRDTRGHKDQGGQYLFQNHQIMQEIGNNLAQLISSTHSDDSMHQMVKVEELWNSM